VRIAAYQAPLLAAGSLHALELIRARVEPCEAEGVSILCCPEAILGGLADYSDDPMRFAIDAGSGQLDSALVPSQATPSQQSLGLQSWPMVGSTTPLRCFTVGR
jgi:hypothetical protein